MDGEDLILDLLSLSDAGDKRQDWSCKCTLHLPYDVPPTSEVIHHIVTQSVESILYLKGLPVKVSIK